MKRFFLIDLQPERRVLNVNKEITANKILYYQQIFREANQITDTEQTLRKYLEFKYFFSLLINRHTETYKMKTSIIETYRFYEKIYMKSKS